MPLKVIRNNIINMDVEAIVNFADFSLVKNGGVDKEIFTNAGEGLINEIRIVGFPTEGKFIITKAYNFKNKYIIHTV